MENIKYDLYDYLIKLVLLNKSIDEMSFILGFDKVFIKTSLKKLKSNIIRSSNESLFHVIPFINNALNIDKKYTINYKLFNIINDSDSDSDIINKLGYNINSYLNELKTLYFCVYMYGNIHERKYLSLIKNKINKYKYINSYNKSKELINLHDKTIISVDGQLHTLNSDYGELYSFDKNKFIVISDTHFGSVFENLDYLKEVYEYASSNNIDSIIHTGDLIEGTYANFERCKSEYKDVYSQIEHVLYNYCYDKNINNYILLGNHDLYSYVDYGVDISEFLRERSDFNILGYKEAYLSLFDDFITLKHDVSRIKNTSVNLPTSLNLIGHSHQYRLTYDKNNIFVKVPALSDVFSNKKYIINKGFILVDIDDSNIIIDYITNDGKKMKLEKKYKKT